MGIIYLITVLILLISFTLVKKTDKEINVVSFLCISIVILFCYNTFICYVLTFFAIPITLCFLALINLSISAIFIILVLKNKEIQRYTFNKVDVLYITVIGLIALIVSYINFNIPFNVKYETSDPAVHYLTSVIFAESDSLLAGIKEKIDPIYDNNNYLKVRKTTSYVNSGLLMKCLCENLEPMKCYNIFVAFGIFTLFMTGATIYSAMLNFSKKKEHIFWAFILSLICMLGYPLNSFLFGFEYLSMGLLIICAIINLVYYYEKENLNIKYFVPLMALLNFGLFSAYYMFVPFMYPALWIYFYIKNYQKTKKIITKDIVILWVATLLIPFILGYIYHLEPKIYAILINKSLDLENMIDYSTRYNKFRICE